MNWLFLFSCGERLTERSAAAGRLELLCQLRKVTKTRVALLGFGDAGYCQAYRRHGSRCKYTSGTLRAIRRDYHWLLRLAEGFLQLIKFGMRLRPNVVYTRDLFSCAVALSLRPILKYSVVRDVRGVIEEFIYTRRAVKPLYKVIESLDRLTIRKSDTVLVVSRTMQQHIRLKYGRTQKLCYVPNCIDATIFPGKCGREEVREGMRSRLQLENRKVIVYSGGLQAWQLFRNTARVVLSLHKFSPDYCFLVLTDRPDAAQAILVEEQFPREAFRLTSSPQKLVPTVLSAADAGICLREANLVNEVSCPTKVIEYLAAGLGLILSNSVGDLSSLVLNSKLGVIVPDCEWQQGQLMKESISRIDALIAMGFNEACYAASKEFTTQVTTKQIAECIDNACTN